MHAASPSHRRHLRFHRYLPPLPLSPLPCLSISSPLTYVLPGLVGTRSASVTVANNDGASPSPSKARFSSDMVVQVHRTWHTGGDDPGPFRRLGHDVLRLVTAWFCLCELQVVREHLDTAYIEACWHDLRLLAGLQCLARSLSGERWLCISKIN